MLGKIRIRSLFHQRLLGLVQQETGDYPAAAASHQQALELFGDLGNRLGQAEALNCLGELSLRTSATGQARDQHTRALAIAREISATPEEARALEGLGRAHIQDGNLDGGQDCLRQALTIYQRTGAPAAQRVRETLSNLSWPGSTERPGPGVTTPTPGCAGRCPATPARDSRDTRPARGVIWWPGRLGG